MISSELEVRCTSNSNPARCGDIPDWDRLNQISIIDRFMPYSWSVHVDDVTTSTADNDGDLPTMLQPILLM